MVCGLLSVPQCLQFSLLRTVLDPGTTKPKQSSVCPKQWPSAGIRKICTYFNQTNLLFLPWGMSTTWLPNAVKRSKNQQLYEFHRDWLEDRIPDFTTTVSSFLLVPGRMGLLITDAATLDMLPSGDEYSMSTEPPCWLTGIAPVLHVGSLGSNPGCFRKSIWHCAKWKRKKKCQSHSSHHCGYPELGAAEKKVKVREFCTDMPN